MTPIVCPRCGHKDTFMKGFLPDTCVCRICQSQLDWQEIDGMGPDCRPATAPAASAGPPADTPVAQSAAPGGEGQGRGEA